MRADDPLLLTLKVFHQIERVLLTLRGPKFAAELSLDPPEKIKLRVIGLVDPIARRFRDLVLLERRDQLGRHNHDRSRSRWSQSCLR